jgi:hypothetical protein
MTHTQKLFIAAIILIPACRLTSQVSFTLPSIVCYKSTHTVTAQHGTISATGYTWTSTPSGVAISHSMLSNTLLHFSTNPGTYTISVVAALSTGTAMASQTVVVNNFPPSISISASSPTVCAGSTANFTASGAASYTWMPGAVQSSVMSGGPGSYTVEGLSAGCTGSAMVSLGAGNCTGVEESGKAEFGFFPNPASDEIIVLLNSLRVTELEICDYTGRCMKSEKITGESEFRINVSQLPEGIYLISINDERGGSSFKKMLLHH